MKRGGSQQDSHCHGRSHLHCGLSERKGSHREPKLQRKRPPPPRPIEGPVWGLFEKQIQQASAQPSLWREADRSLGCSPVGNSSQKTKAVSATTETPRWNFCLEKLAPSTSRWSLGEAAMTQTWRIFCGLVGGAHCTPRQCQSKVEELKNSLDSLHFRLWLTSSTCILSPPFGGGLGRIFFFKENIHLGL